MGQIVTAKIAELDSIQGGPETLTRVQLRGISRQALHMESRRRPIGQERFDGVAAMNWCASPDDDQAAGRLQQQMLQQGNDIFRIDWAVLAGEIQLGFGRDGPDRREMIATPPLPGDGCVSHWRIGADNTGQGTEPRLVYEADGLLLGLRPFLMAGQVS
jgi:hypothetical protein